MQKYYQLIKKLYSKLTPNLDNYYDRFRSIGATEKQLKFLKENTEKFTKNDKIESRIYNIYNAMSESWEDVLKAHQ